MSRSLPVNCLSHQLLTLTFAWGTHAIWIVAALAVLATIVLGWSDIARFHLGRIWALSDTCFTESMRRRVLLVTPLAILGVITVVQLQRPSDEQDAIRQTIKFCLFTSGLIVTVTALILACTNLPKEIETRVIYTIVTKPTTRLEIVLGKVIGFARVSGMIILIMGIFTYGYLELRNWRLVRGITERLSEEPTESVQHAALSHWAGRGFLDTKSLEFPREVGIFSRETGPDGIQWMAGGKSEFFAVPFEPTESQRSLLLEAVEKGAEVDLLVTLQLERHKPTEDDLKMTRELGIKNPAAASHILGPVLPDTRPSTQPQDEVPAQIKVRVLDDQRRPLIGFEEFDNNSSGITVVPPTDGRPGAVIRLKETLLPRLAGARSFIVEVSGITPSVEFGAGEMPVVFFVPAAEPDKAMIKPQFQGGKPVTPLFLSHTGHRGMILTGDPKETGTVAVYRFRNADVGHGSGGKVPFQVNLSFERNGEFQDTTTSFSVVALQVRNRNTATSSGTIRITPEMDRTTYFDVPQGDVAGGNFDVTLRDLTAQQQLGLELGSLAVVTADRSFAFNLFKSLLVLWMLCVLVVVISVFCSTFLSWPIAVVLTLVILLGRWGVDELGDALNPGVGRGVAGEFKVTDPGASRVVSTSVEALARTLKSVAVALPDVSRFPVSEDIERGISIPPARLAGAAEVLLLYGLILISASYLILKRKEVAP